MNKLNTKYIEINYNEAKRLEQLLMKSIKANHNLLQNSNAKDEQKISVKSAMKEKKILLKKVRTVIDYFDNNQ